MERLDWAKWFVEHGFAIFPLEPGSKKPIIKEWQKYSTTQLSEEEKVRYLDMVGKGYNFAVPGGQKGLVILDFEDMGLVKTWVGEKVLYELCEKTLCVLTPHGGIHIYFLSDDIPPHKFNPVFTQNGKGIADLQSFNSYVVGVGSCINHKYCDVGKCQWKGQDYETCYTPYLGLDEVSSLHQVSGLYHEVSSPPHEVSGFHHQVFSPQKVDLKGLLRFFEERGKGFGIGLSPSARGWVYGKGQLQLEKLREEMGKYDQYRVKTVEMVREEVCKKLNEKIKVIRSEKVKRVFNTAYGVVCEGKTYHELGIDRSTGDWRVLTVLLSLGVTDLNILEQLLPLDSKVFAPKWDRYFEYTLRKAWMFVKPILEFQAQAKGKDKGEVRRIVKSVITDILLKRFKIKTFYTTTGHTQSVLGVFAWDKEKGIYKPFDKSLRREIRRVAEFLDLRSRDKTFARLSKRDVDDIFDEVKDLTLAPLPKEPLRVAFKNGTLEWVGDDLRWYKVEERSPKQFAFYYLPFELKFEEIEFFKGKEVTVEDVEGLAKRLCPKSLEAFKSWVDEKWVTLFEIIGYTFYPEVKFRKAFMLLGEGRNGKSTFINLLKEILGEYAIDISPRELFDSQNRFVVASLYHKLANAVAESKDYTIDDMDRFKRLTGGDWFTADVKFKEPITFRNVAKIVVASNNMPFLRDTNDKAFWSRWLVIEFPHQFQDDDTWFRRTFTQEELDGVVTVSLLAFMRVVQKRRFDFEQSEKEVMDIWLSKTDSVYAFVHDSLKDGVITLDPRNGDLWVARSDLYRLYRSYCVDQGFRGVGRKSFARKLREYFGINTMLKNIHGKRVRAFVGIAVDEHVIESLVSSDVDVDSFLNYVKQFNGVTKEYWEVVKDFGDDKEKANKFLSWCERRRFCYQKGVSVWEIRTW
jgi:putative DNA primase/helicase